MGPASRSRAPVSGVARLRSAMPRGKGMMKVVLGELHLELAFDLDRKRCTVAGAGLAAPGTFATMARTLPLSGARQVSSADRDPLALYATTPPRRRPVGPQSAIMHSERL